MSAPEAPVARRTLRVRGLVQGVGFRPFVYRLAERHGLGGWVRNETDGVAIEVEGPPAAVDRFTAALRGDGPPTAVVRELEWAPADPIGEDRFHIEPSESSVARAPILPVDQATCDACAAELFDPGNRRYRYPFITCTVCGPRLTVVEGAPYDRERTSMRDFPLCAACREEYEDPGSRRFHAESIACADCGPRLELRTSTGARAGGDPLKEAVAALREGRIVAVKGLGGVHLACDAGDEAAVGELRRRKGRDSKPFAVMVKDVAAARRLARVSPAEEALLVSPARPIVLLRRAEGDGLPAAVAPG
ncbi:MAG TPA: acylphosphatase, partial [Planctomycetota bacterium]|nr:acylphosphatase [Planctomycetota bacterium]